MTFAAHKRILFNGTYAAAGGVGAEIFVFGLADTSDLSPADLAAAMVTPAETWFHSDDAHIVDIATLTSIRVQSIGTDGKVITSFSVDCDSVGSALQQMPNICCAAITLETGVLNAKGGKLRGRFYPPNSGWAVNGNGFGTGFGLNIAQSGAELLTALNAAGAQISVASQSAGGTNATVTGCSADNVVDTQRRRKDAEVGVRGAQAIPYTP